MSAADIYIILYGHFQTEAGCRILINIILLRLASTMQTDKSGVNIIPEFPIPKTVFETASGSYSFSGVIDFLLAKVAPKYSSQLFVLSPWLAA